MECYLKKLANDETTVDDFVQFLKSHTIDKEAMIEIVYALKCKLDLKNIDEYFNSLIPYMPSMKLTRTHILKTSHVFCEKCDFFVQSSLCNWVKNNPELFETEIYFFHRFLSFMKTLIKNDLSFYPLSAFDENEPPTSSQTNDEKIKILNTIVHHYNNLLTR